MGRCRQLAKRCLQLFVLLMVWTLLCTLLLIYITHGHSKHHAAALGQEEDDEKTLPNESSVGARVADAEFVRAVLKRTDSTNTILLALVDAAFANVALNFYLTSLRPHGIENYLFVGVSEQSCTELRQHEIACFKYAEDDNAAEDSEFNSADFLRKTNLRTEMILDVLLAGVTVIQSDVDVVFLKNPMPELYATTAELAPMWDDGNYNAGFVLIRPSKQNVRIYDMVRTITMNNNHTNDQEALNTAIEECLTFQYCNISKLNISRFLNGLYYFEENKHVFGRIPCDKCVVVHNNYIVSKAAKIHRFKEAGLWAVDERGYYSSPSRKYLTFHIDVTTSSSQHLQLHALRTALIIGHLLNRVVILPRFSCPEQPRRKCPMNSLYQIATFEDHFGGKYRESSFLDSPLVHSTIKSSTRSCNLLALTGVENGTAFISVEDLYKCDDKRTSVLSLGSLNHVRMTDGLSDTFAVKLRDALNYCDYRQLCAIS